MTTKIIIGCLKNNYKHILILTKKRYFCILLKILRYLWQKKE